MKIGAIFILSILLFKNLGFGQVRIVSGKVIDTQLRPIYGVSIKIDSALLVVTDINGNFKIDIPIETKSLKVFSVSMDEKIINLQHNCDNYEIIMAYSGHFDFMSARKVDRLRKKEFTKLPKIHRSAFEKSIFKSAKPCFVDNFISIKKRLKEIHKRRSQMPST